MHSIYFNNRILRVCNISDTCISDPNAVVLHSPNDTTLDGLACLFESNENIKLLCVAVEESAVQETYNRIAAHFTPINAGGGLVQNQRGEYLLIFRNGLWDLPKGKQEEGEDIALTALREVEEECGITALEQGELICITHHTYRMNGRHMLKDTYWYNMKYTGDCSRATPQQEEGISQCKWVPAAEVATYVKDTYPSIRKVFEETGLL